MSDDVFSAIKELLNSEDWPEAVPPYMICDESSELDKQKRAEGIISLVIDTDLKDKVVLDFGTGEGHIVEHLSIMPEAPSKAVGYDIHRPDTVLWNNQNNFVLTTDFNAVVENGPYDVVILYDVLDHAEVDSPVDILKKIKSVMSPGAKLYIRNHPWCSRHGGHLYQKINKAFVHLIFSSEELIEMGYEESIPNQKVIHPRNMYKDWIDESGFNFKPPFISQTNVEDFFKKNILKQRLSKAWAKSTDAAARQWPGYQMSQNFLDFILIA